MIARATHNDVSIPEEAALELSNVSKTFGSTRALKSVSLKVSAAEFTALIGPSGSGKSTLLKLCNGLATTDRIEESHIKLFGHTIQSSGKLSPDIRQLRSRIGFIFQSFNLVNRLSLHKNVLIGASSRTPTWRNLLYCFRKVDCHLAMQALDQVGLSEQATQRASTLSGGQQQRGAIARAITQKAELVLADEPVASLDPKSSHRIMTALSELARQGVTVVVSLHQIDLAKQYCDRIVALNSGSIHFSGSPEELDDAKLRSIYGDSTECDTDLPLSPLDQTAILSNL